MKSVLGGALWVSLVAAGAISTVSAQDDVKRLNTTQCGVFIFVEVSRDKNPDGTDAGPELEEGANTLSFLYDTGAGFTVVDPDALEELTGTRVQSGKRVNITNARSGDAQFTSFPTQVRDLDRLSLALGREIDGILAHDAFRGFVADLNYEDGTITLTRGSLPRPNRRDIFSTKGKDDRPWIRVNFAGRTRKVLIDSGSSGSFSVNDIEKFSLTTEPVRTGYSVRYSSIEDRLGGRLDGDARFGDFTLEQPMLSNVPGSELFGGRVLRHFNLSYDADNRRIRFTPRKGAEIPPPPSAMTGGFHWVPSNGELEVKNLIEGFENAHGGIEVGDRAIAVNGTPMAERGCSNPDKTPESYELTIARGEETLGFTITPQVLIP
ncbi:MAG: hypothetical protein AAF830_17450 [Pseudomonadota bacterium]